MRLDLIKQGNCFLSLIFFLTHWVSVRVIHCIFANRTICFNMKELREECKLQEQLQAVEKEIRQKTQSMLCKWHSYVGVKEYSADHAQFASISGSTKYVRFAFRKVEKIALFLLNSLQTIDFFRSSGPANHSSEYDTPLAQLKRKGNAEIPG
jgi:hypothetical protein